MHTHALALAFVSILGAGSVAAQERTPAGPEFRGRFTLLVAEASATPQNYVGACPGRIVFSGDVRLALPGQAVPNAQLSYTWLRSDGATTPVIHVDSGHTKLLRINESWTVGGASLLRFAGWEQLKVWWTGQGEASAVASNRAAFDVTCR